MRREGILTVVSGFSGAGKGTVMKRLMELYGDTYALSVSATSRAQRPGEEEGREYFFKTEDEFKEMISKGRLKMCIRDRYNTFERMMIWDRINFEPKL